MDPTTLARVILVSTGIVAAIFACAPPPATADCSKSETDCNGSCFNLDIDPDNCGICGNICDDGLTCKAGACVRDCNAGQTVCNDECVDLKTDPTHCGACANVCGPPTVDQSGKIVGSGTCVNGACLVPDAGTDAPVDAPVDAGPQCTPGLVIGEVFAQGGNTVANDYVVIRNRNGSAVSLAGMSLQTINGGGNGDWSVVNLTGSIPARGFYLVQFAAGGSGTAIPTADATSTIDLQDTSVRIAIVSTTTALTGDTPGPFIDGIGVGDTIPLEGTDLIFHPDGQALRRKTDRCTDTNKSAADFEAATAAPANTSTAALACACP